MQRRAGFEKTFKSDKDAAMLKASAQGFTEPIHLRLETSSILCSAVFKCPTFNLDGRIIGKQGCHLRQIEQSSGAQVYFRCTDRKNKWRDETQSTRSEASSDDDHSSSASTLSSDLPDLSYFEIIGTSKQVCLYICEMDSKFLNTDLILPKSNVGSRAGENAV